MLTYLTHLFLLFIFFYSTSYSQIKNNPFHQKPLVSIEGGITLAKTDYRNSIPGSGLRGMFEYFFFYQNYNSIGFRVFGGGKNIHGRDNRKDLISFKTGMYFVGAGGLYSYSFNGKYHPYIFAGFSYNMFDIELNGNNTEIKTLDNQTSFSYDLELGLKMNLTDNITFNISSGVNFMTDDMLDNSAVGLNNDFYMTGMAGLSFSFFSRKDSDDDGIEDDKDACPKSAEDFDGFADHDGCPDFDNDNDNILDKDDKCPNLAEDFDGFDDFDGCPDVDNDNDGILDEDDKCINVTEDFDGFEDEDGCPDLDNDNDNIPDENDKCPELPEDLDGFNDTDGCPDIDNDNDGLLDVNDECPDQPETYNKYQDTDGCPDTAPKPEIQQQYIPPREIEKPVPEEEKEETPVIDKFILHGIQTFDRENIEIKPDAYGNLNKIAEVIKNNPNSKWRIEGYMDNSLPDEQSMDLSRKRAQAILKYFVSKGIPASRFETAGMGEKNPIESNEKVYGRMRNRRIEIKMIK